MKDWKSTSIGHLWAALARAAEVKVAPDKAVPVITALEIAVKMSSANEQENLIKEEKPIVLIQGLLEESKIPETDKEPSKKEKTRGLYLGTLKFLKVLQDEES